MNNEQKILTILEMMQTDISGLRKEQESMRELLIKVSLTQENIVIPHLKLLSEGRTDIQEQIRNLSVIDRMQDDISTLKAAIKYLSAELESLKSAM